MISIKPIAATDYLKSTPAELNPSIAKLLNLNLWAVLPNSDIYIRSDRKRTSFGVRAMEA